MKHDTVWITDAHSGEGERFTIYVDLLLNQFVDINGTRQRRRSERGPAHVHGSSTDRSSVTCRSGRIMLRLDADRAARRLYRERLITCPARGVQVAGENPQSVA